MINYFQTSKIKNFFKVLQSWHLVLAALYVIQAVFLLVFSHSHSYPILTNYLTVDPLATQAAGHPSLALAVKHLTDINLAYLLAAMLILSAAIHLGAAMVKRSQYDREIQKEVNKFKWLDYSISTSLLLVVIGLLSGVYDLVTLKSIIILTIIMGLVGWMSELYRQATKRLGWIALTVSYIAGIAPLLFIATYIFGATAFGIGQLPTFVYIVYVSIFTFFICYAANMYLQVKKIGPWKDYVFGEKANMLLNLVAKTAIVWLVFIGILYS